MEHKCPTCDIPMDEGFIPERTMGAAAQGVFAEGTPEFGFFGGVKMDGHRLYALTAYRCPRCGLVHLYATKRPQM